MVNVFSDLVNFAYMVKFGHKGIHAYCMANILCWEFYSRRVEKNMKWSAPRFPYSFSSNYDLIVISDGVFHSKFYRIKFLIFVKIGVHR